MAEQLFVSTLSNQIYNHIDDLKCEKVCGIIDEGTYNQELLQIEVLYNNWDTLRILLDNLYIKRTNKERGGEREMEREREREKK